MSAGTACLRTLNATKGCAVRGSTHRDRTLSLQLLLNLICAHCSSSASNKGPKSRCSMRKWDRSVNGVVTSDHQPSYSMCSR